MKERKSPNIILEIIVIAISATMILVVGYLKSEVRRPVVIDKSSTTLDNLDRLEGGEEAAQPSEIDVFHWERYRNMEYGFEIEFPDSFVMEWDPSPSPRHFTIASPNLSIEQLTLENLESLHIEIIIHEKPLPVGDLALQVIKNSPRLNVVQHNKTIFAGRNAYRIRFTGAIKYDPILGAGMNFYGMTDVLYIQHNPYIIAVFIPHVRPIFTDIAATLTLL